MKRYLWGIGLLSSLLFAGSHFKDGDLDGVPDKRDKCQNTPFFVLVDSKGCAVKTLAVNIKDTFTK